MESILVHHRTFSLRGAGGRSGPPADARRRAPQCPHVPVGDQGMLETRRAGALLLTSSEGEASSDSVPSAGAHPQGMGAARSLHPPATVNGGERVWLRSAHARGVKLSRGESALRVVLQKSNDDITAQRSPRRIFGNEDDEDERELAQSGRPRRAKGCRTADHGGKTAAPSTRETGARKGVAGLSASSRWKASLGRGSRSLFTGRVGKAILAEWVFIVRKRGEQTREATETSEVGRSIINRVRNAPCGGENPLQGARADRRSAWSVVKRTKHRKHGGNSECGR